MDFFKTPGNGSMTYSLVILTGLLILSFLLATRLRESKLLTEEKTAEVNPVNPTS
jgi:Na+(H+)/acetate symporter ActP